MMNDKIQSAFNDQIKHEMESAYLYLSMAAYFHSLNLDGFAKWLTCQSREEMVHAMKFFDHIRDRGGRIRLAALSQPKSEWSNPKQAFEDAYKYEQFTTAKIDVLVKLSREVSDYASVPLLNWFEDEQIEEESSTAKIVANLERIKESGAGLVMLDKELGKRE